MLLLWRSLLLLRILLLLLLLRAALLRLCLLENSARGFPGLKGEFFLQVFKALLLLYRSLRLFQRI